MSEHVERVAEALRLADENNGADNESDHYRFQAQAAIEAHTEALGLTEETAFKYTHLASGRHTILDDLSDIKTARKIAGSTHELTEVSRLVSPWVQAGAR